MVTPSGTIEPFAARFRAIRLSTVLEAVPEAQDNDCLLMKPVAQDIAALPEGDEELPVFSVIDPCADPGMLEQKACGFFEGFSGRRPDCAA